MAINKPDIPIFIHITRITFTSFKFKVKIVISTIIVKYFN